MQLVYIAPVEWVSFAQRPHKFVMWFHTQTNGNVLWIDPYPTRLPSISDLQRLRRTASKAVNKSPQWLQVIKPSALPIEPLPCSAWVNALIWQSTLKRIDEFSNNQDTLLLIGKPSAFALTVLRRMKNSISIYDAMDDFSAFYSGISRHAIYSREQKIVNGVTHMLTSSTNLYKLWSKFRCDIQLIFNGLDTESISTREFFKPEREKKILGYVGTIGSWFDWEWVIELAKARPSDIVRLIGPVFVSNPTDLPRNIEIHPPCHHLQAIEYMHDFDIGLIPFKINTLTKSVDPIKYYEYTALDLAIISTDFGEMSYRATNTNVFICKKGAAINHVIEKALLYKRDPKKAKEFCINNSWDTRFSTANII